MSSTALSTPLNLEGNRSSVAPRRDTRRNALIASVSALAALLLLAAAAFHGYIAWMVAYPYVAPVYSNPMEAKQLSYSDITFPSQSGRTTVSGWYIPAGSGHSVKEASDRTVILSHGYGANREETWVPMYDLASCSTGFIITCLCSITAMPPSNTEPRRREAGRSRSSCSAP
ncbi:hypothetical protein [Paenibacillus sp. P22]|uniref:hypothetical protein n=1 Tax=Paenibacillus sp. P22 TaxID=483908 RepID=UPI000404C6BA|nr:hypothetical protein [Paenibacillus sp. P22]